jgi:hypothetical protein
MASKLKEKQGHRGRLRYTTKTLAADIFTRATCSMRMHYNDWNIYDVTHQDKLYLSWRYAMKWSYFFLAEVEISTVPFLSHTMKSLMPAQRVVSSWSMVDRHIS